MSTPSTLFVTAALASLVLAASGCSPRVEVPSGFAFGAERDSEPDARRQPRALAAGVAIASEEIPAAPGGAAPRREGRDDGDLGEHDEQAGTALPRIAAAVSHDAMRLVGDLLPTLRIAGTENTDRGAIELVLMGKVTIAVVARSVSANERKAGIEEQVLGWHVPVLVVHPSNPVQSLARNEVREVLGTKLQTWARLGGPLARIQVLAPPEGPEADHFAALFMPGDRIGKGATLVEGVAERLARCARDPHAVAIASLVDVQRRADVRPLALGMVPPSALALEQGKYPAGCAVRLVWKTRDERIEGLLGETRSEPWLSRVAPRLVPK